VKKNGKVLDSMCHILAARILLVENQNSTLLTENEQLHSRCIRLEQGSKNTETQLNDSTVKCENLEKQLDVINRERQKLENLAKVNPVGCITYTFSKIKDLLAGEKRKSPTINIDVVQWYFAVELSDNNLDVIIYRLDNSKKSLFSSKLCVNLLSTKLGVKPIHNKSYHLFQAGIGVSLVRRLIGYKDLKSVDKGFITEDGKITVQLIIYENSAH